MIISPKFQSYLLPYLILYTNMELTWEGRRKLLSPMRSLVFAWCHDSLKKTKTKTKKRSEAVIFWYLDKPVLRELNDVILTKEFSFLGVKKKKKQNKKHCYWSWQTNPQGNERCYSYERIFFCWCSKKKKHCRWSREKTKNTNYDNASNQFLILQLTWYILSISCDTERRSSSSELDWWADEWTESFLSWTGTYHKEGRQ